MTQSSAFELLKTGANIFLTGEPGSGKTYTIQRYIEYLKGCGIDVAVTASTGIAATHCGGMTIHSWSGIGIKKFLSEQDLDALSMQERLVRRANRASILIIDEISMLDASILDAVDAALRATRNKNESFGGMQVVFVGDFFQLPPISRAGEAPSRFAYESAAWQEAKPIVCYLTEQHRQEDVEFLNVLTSIRRGDIASDVLNILSSRSVMPEGGVHTRLYSHNANVDQMNDEKLAEIESGSVRFSMESRGQDNLVLQLKKSCLSPDMLQLKVGAHVMFTKNNPELGYANGTLGVVTDFDEMNMPVVKMKNGKKISVPLAEWTVTEGQRILARISQVPLRLAWAITVHKSQGMTLDAAIMDLSSAFEYGQGYVALSRVKSLKGLFLMGYNDRALEVHPAVAAADGIFKEQSSAADSYLSSMSPAELKKMQENFVRVCGGDLTGTKAAKKRARAAEKNETGTSTKSTSSTRTTKRDTIDITHELFKLDPSVASIAQTRGLAEGTVISHLEQLFMKGRIEKEELLKAFPESLQREIPIIVAVFHELGSSKLTPVFERFNNKYSYDEIKIARIFS